ncbi:MAG TPA: hypothetical protein EYQ69_04835 [Gemmatimonadetes bacterium]|jgi:hypothetical protein|nr:hypothetical protein [Gemmatimonadota bacterium]
MNLFVANPVFIGALTTVSLLAIGILYWIKPPPPTVVVSSSIFWTRLLSERKKSSFIDRLRWLLSLIMALTIAILLTTASGAPELFSSEKSEIENVTMILDNSGTMATFTADGSTRWDRAVRVARSFLTEAHPSAEFLILDTSGQLVSRTTTNKWEALEVLEELEVSFGNNVHFPVFTVNEARTMFISDGVSSIDVPPGIEIISVFEPAENVGITSLSINPGLSGLSASPRGLVQVTNGSLTTKEVSIRVSGLGDVNTRVSLTLDPGRSGLSDIDLSGFGGGPLRVSVTSVRDAFAEDDLAYVIMPSSSKYTVTLVTSGNLYLETALEAMSNVNLLLMEPEYYDPGISTDLYIFDRFDPEVLPSKPTLTFLSAEASLPQIFNQNIVTLNSLERHPVLRGVTLSDLRIGQVSNPSFLDENSQILWGDAQNPLLVVKDFDTKEVQIGFSLEGSNFPLQPAFPIFLSNSIEWALENDLPNVSSPGRVRIPLANATVVDLEGVSVETSYFDGTTMFLATAPNLYSVHQGVDRFWVPVNLTNLEYTLVNRSDLNTETATGMSLDSSDGLGGEVKPILWKLLVLMALFLVTLEWVTYHRRITV